MVAMVFRYDSTIGRSKGSNINCVFLQLQGHDETTHLYHILDVDVPILLGCIHMILAEMTHASN